MIDALSRILSPRQRVRCDSCGGRFEPDLRDVLLEDGMTKRSFTCPHCERDYPVALITARGMEITRLLRDERRPDEMQALLDEMRDEVHRGPAASPAASKPHPNTGGSPTMTNPVGCHLNGGVNLASVDDVLTTVSDIIGPDVQRLLDLHRRLVER